jgi:hypothetical protein
VKLSDFQGRLQKGEGYRRTDNQYANDYNLNLRPVYGPSPLLRERVYKQSPLQDKPRARG